VVAQIARRLDDEPEPGITGERDEHVVEERLAGGDLEVAATEPEGDAHSGLTGLAGDRAHRLNSFAMVCASSAPV
jgi:hypothetical protein